MSPLRRTLYPALEPHDFGRLRVSPVHELYYEVSGNPPGPPWTNTTGLPAGLPETS